MGRTDEVPLCAGAEPEFEAAITKPLGRVRTRNFRRAVGLRSADDVDGGLDVSTASASRRRSLNAAPEWGDPAPLPSGVRVAGGRAASTSVIPSGGVWVTFGQCVKRHCRRDEAAVRLSAQEGPLWAGRRAGRVVHDSTPPLMLKVGAIVQVVDRLEARGLTILTRDDCMRLLERGGLGRIAVPGQLTPIMRPVNFAVQDGRIVMRTADGALWAAAEAKVGASFEFDEIRNEDHRAWNVIVTGELEPLSDAVAAGGRRVKAWAPTPNERTIALRIVDVSGRSVPEPHSPHARPQLTSGAAEPGVGRRVVDQDGDGIDRWGRSERTRKALRVLVDPAYRHWFRFSFENVDRIPRRGGAILVANHAGVVPVSTRRW